MVKTASTMLPLGTQAPDFSLTNVDGQTVSPADFQGAPALLVMFICNHCPFVKHIAHELAALGHEYQQRGVAVVAISSNDISNHPEDSPEQMVHEVENRGYTFPYLYDENKEVAKAYHAACTPDFFVFDGEQKLAYRGQLDDQSTRFGHSGDGRGPARRAQRGIGRRADRRRAISEHRLQHQTGRPATSRSISMLQGCEPDLAAR